MLVADLFRNECTADIARPCSTSTCHLVAAGILDKLLATTRLGAGTNLGVGNSLFDLETALGLVLLFDFGTFERDVSRLPAQLA